MKTSIKCSIMANIAIVLLLVMSCDLNAQILSVKGNVTLDNVSTFERYTVKILNMDTDSVTVFNSFKAFTYKLDYNSSYTIVISKEGYQSKSIYIDTHCDSKQSFRYVFDCNLKSDDVRDNYVCQAGSIFYNSNKREFDYSYSK